MCIGSFSFTLSGRSSEIHIRWSRRGIPFPPSGNEG